MRGNLYPELLDRWVDKPTKTLFGSGYAGLGYLDSEQLPYQSLSAFCQNLRRELCTPSRWEGS